LYQEKFNEAASTFEILINTGNYRLVQTADLTAEQINGGLTPFGSILKLKEKMVQVFV
jgi:sugar diacid utilization regulator